MSHHAHHASAYTASATATQSSCASTRAATSRLSCLQPTWYDTTYSSTCTVTVNLLTMWSVTCLHFKFWTYRYGTTWCLEGKRNSSYQCSTSNRFIYSVADHGSRCRTRFGVGTEMQSAGKLFNCIRWVLNINQILSDHRISPDEFSVSIYRGVHNLGLCTTSHLSKSKVAGHDVYLTLFFAEINVFCRNCQTVYSGIIFAKGRVSVYLFINSTQLQRCELMSWLIH